MVNDISQEIIDAKKIIDKLEKLNANPLTHGHINIYNTLIELDIKVQELFDKWEKYERL